MTVTALTNLAQGSSVQQAQSDILWWLGVIVVAAVALALIALAIRKAVNRASQTPMGGGVGFTISDLRRMHEQGELTDEEFENAKKLITARSRAAMGADDDQKSDESDKNPPSGG